MPAIITHDTFGRDVYGDLYRIIGNSKDECDSFLLGCQGPDVLFFSKLSPTLVAAHDLGEKMHSTDAAELLFAFKRAIDMLPSTFKPIGQSYLSGFVCHYLLDSQMHPFIYAQQFELCNAGVDGLDDRSASEVHATIESDLDILVLSTKENKTISQYDPSSKTLNISRHALHVISLIYKNVSLQLFGCEIPDNTIDKSVSNYRAVLSLLYSPSGIKRFALGSFERIFRQHSFMQAMSHRNVKMFESDFDNHGHAPWKDPWTGVVSTSGFWDIYHNALNDAIRIVPALNDADLAFFEQVAHGRNFKGDLTRAALISVE